jgi:hypothetical protein
MSNTLFDHHSYKRNDEFNNDIFGAFTLEEHLCRKMQEMFEKDIGVQPIGIINDITMCSFIPERYEPKEGDIIVDAEFIEIQETKSISPILRIDNQPFIFGTNL